VFVFGDFEQFDHKGGKRGVRKGFYEYGKLRGFSENSLRPQEKFLTNKIVAAGSNICATQHWVLGASYEQSLVNFGDGHNAL